MNTTQNIAQHVSTMKKVYAASLLMSVLVGVYLFELRQQVIPENVLMWLAFIPFFLFTYGIIGLIISYQTKKEHSFFWWIAFPLLVAILFYGFLFVHVFVLEPYLCPCLQP